MKARARGRGGRIGLLVVGALAATAASCRRSEALPEVPGARHVVPFSSVRLFRETPVSTREFDAEDRRWKQPTSPRFDEGRLRSRTDADGGTVMMEIPPKMAFRNRGDDCGPADERRVCALPWDKVQITLCGRPLDGHLDIPNDRLGDASLFVCRVIAPAKEHEDGFYEWPERDCTHAPHFPLRSLHPQDLTFLVGQTALVADPGATYDRTVCAKLDQMRAGPGGARDAAGEAGSP